MDSMEKINVLVVNKIDEGTLKKIASISPQIRVITTGRLWESSETADGKDRDCDKPEFADMLAQAEVIFGWRPPPNVIARAPRLKWIQSFLSGVDSILDRELINSPVVLTNTSGLQANQLTELAFEFMLMFAKLEPMYFRFQLERKWERHTMGKLKGRTLGIIGLGKIGMQMASVGKAFGMRVLGARRSLKKVGHTRHVEAVYPLDQLDCLLRESDFVVSLLPSTPATYRMIGRKEFQQMKPSACFINLGRGDTVAEEDLIAALEQKWIAGAGLDCFAKEPLPAESKLWGFPNVIITPHIAGRMDDYVQQAAELFCKNLALYVQGKKLFNIVDKKQGY